MNQADRETMALRAGLPAAMAGVAGTVRWRHSSRARRVSLRIDAREGTVVVTLPPRTARRAGMALLATHAAWIAQRLATLAPRVALVPGAVVPLGGVPHVVRVVADGAGRVAVGVIVVKDGPDLPRRIVAVLRGEALARIAALVERHAAALGATPRALRLKDTRSRWGSCAPDGTLAFSWRLVMAPGWVLDYVVAHEAAHLREMNHSSRFWAQVAALTPHRDAAVAWLRANGPALLRVG